MKRFKVVARYISNKSAAFAGVGILALANAASATPTYTPLIDMTDVADDVKTALTGPVGAFLAIGIGLWLVRLVLRMGKKFVSA